MINQAPPSERQDRSVTRLPSQGPKQLIGTL